MNSRFTHPQLAERKHRFIRDIQNIQRKSIFKRARSQLLNNLSQEELNALINDTYTKISDQQLASLVGYVNQQYPEAVGHLGNLILDQYVKVGQMERFQLKAGYHPRWLWLIEVMVEREYCTLELLSHVISTISPKRSEQMVKRAISILFKITSSNLHSPMLLRSQDTLIAILNACMRSDSASQPAYLLVYHLVMMGQQHLRERVQFGMVRQRVLQILITGSLRKDGRVKYFTCQIISQLLKQGLLFPELNQTMFVLLKQSIQHNFQNSALDMMTTFVIKADVQDVIELIELGLIVQLGGMKKQFTAQEDDENHLKLIVLGKEINQRVRRMGLLSKGVNRQLQRFQLLSFSHYQQF